MASSTERRPTSAVSTCVGRGKSLNAAAVTMPSVPSLPMNNLLQVIAAIVLAQHFQPVPHPAVGQHDFEAKHKVARHAVAQHVEAAGIGGDIAADAAAALRAEGDRQQAILRFGGAFGFLEDAAGLDHHGKIDGADGAQSCSGAPAR